MNHGVAVSKMHGARNDFIVLDARNQSIPDLRAFALAACDRHTGIGADGVLVIGDSARAPVSMRVINANGGEAEMCGNGVRCVARYLDQRGEGGEFDVDTIGGIVHTSVVERGEVYRVRVDVGLPLLESRDRVVPRSAVLVVGNRHLVLFRESIDTFDLESFGESAQTDARFPEGINVHLACVEDARTIRARHYERGAGLTMACGTGSVACAAAAILEGAVASPVVVRVPGGALTVEWDGTGSAYMTGPAVHVFDTTFGVPALETA
jgi:diaminopimelate epimerase